MTAVTELAARREIAEIEQRRPDVIRRDPHRQSPPHAGLLHRIATLITTENLPPAHININGRDILIDATNGELVQNTVRRWAQALDLIVTEVAYDSPDGTAATLWSASGWDGTGCWWHIAGALPVPATSR